MARRHGRQFGTQTRWHVTCHGTLVRLAHFLASLVRNLADSLTAYLLQYTIYLQAGLDDSYTA